jgi:predicted RNA-binding protein with PUA-like domain
VWRAWPKSQARPIPDASQFDPKSPYYDPKATPENPRWTGIDVKAVKQGRFVELKELRTHPELENMRLLAKGSRLSVMPVEAAEWRFILKLIGK